jgi:predicted NBD/HSP70 family sugar kinase
MTSSLTVGAEHTRPIRRDNETRVLETLLDRGPASRTELAVRTGLSRTTVFDVVTDLLRKDIVVQTLPTTPQKTRGRPTSKVALNLRATLVAGVDMGRRYTRVVLANAAYEQVGRGAEPVDDALRNNLPLRAQHVIDLIRRTADSAGLTLDALQSIGVGLSGIVNIQLLSVDVAELRTRLEDEFDAKVSVSNNSRLAALAEFTWGAAYAIDDVLYVRWSSGIGSGLIVGGQLIYGAHGAAGEIGHVSLDPFGGRECYCGNRGCLEMYVGSEALLADCAAEGIFLKDEADLVTAARAGSPFILELIAKAAALLGQVIAACAVQFDPELVVVGGDIAELGELVLGPIQQALNTQAVPNSPRQIVVVQSSLDANIAARGAVAMVMPGLKL